MTKSGFPVAMAVGAATEQGESARMPIVFREGGLSYYFFSNEGSPREPVHIHVRGGGRDAKIWVEPEIAIADSYGFSSTELARILGAVGRNRLLIVKAWHEHFADGRSL